MKDPGEIERARAARALLVDARKHEHRDQAAEEMGAFMDIFHPGDPRTDELIKIAREKGK